MTQNDTELLGFVAATLTTLAFVPQVWLTWKTRRAEGISLGMYAVFTTGVLLWLVYGVNTGSWPIVAANGVTLVLSLAILVMKYWFSRRDD
jgi:MtN3 and saliva related transmembrane protein